MKGPIKFPTRRQYRLRCPGFVITTPVFRRQELGAPSSKVMGRINGNPFWAPSHVYDGLRSTGILRLRLLEHCTPDLELSPRLLFGAHLAAGSPRHGCYPAESWGQSARVGLRPHNASTAAILFFGQWSRSTEAPRTGTSWKPFDKMVKISKPPPPPEWVGTTRSDEHPAYARSRVLWAGLQQFLPNTRKEEIRSTSNVTTLAVPHAFVTKYFRVSRAIHSGHVLPRPVHLRSGKEGA